MRNIGDVRVEKLRFLSRSQAAVALLPKHHVSGTSHVLSVNRGGREVREGLHVTELESEADKLLRQLALSRPYNLSKGKAVSSEGGRSGDT